MKGSRDFPVASEAPSFYDTLQHRIRPFEPREPGVVRMYNCGPTVYAYAHIGNFCAFMLADLLRRYLEFKGYEVTQVMNLTDVGHLTEDDIDEGEDKLQAAARRERLDPWAIADRYIQAFHQDRQALGLRDAHHYPRATEYVPRMIEAVAKLLESGHAYQVGGEVYYDISRFTAYGRLSGNTLEQLSAGARVAVNEHKRQPHDFALWKTDPKHLMQWDAPWGRGFPGWHIECSVMSRSLLGDTLDIHTGGEDNIFPHHESEIAQSEALTGRPFVRHWLHTRHLLVDGQKMSKSKGNFFTVRDLLERGFSGRQIRYLLLSTHYRAQQNFTLEALEGTAAPLERLDDCVRRLAKTAGGAAADDRYSKTQLAFKRGFEAALDDDLNVSGALGALFDHVRHLNSSEMSPEFATKALRLLREVDGVLGIFDFEARDAAADLPAAVQVLLDQRARARAARDYAASDRLRDEIKALGWAVQDGKDGQTVKRL